MPADAIAAQLEETYVRIQKERMRDMPLLNRKLRVEAVGFRDWGAYSAIGVLITPWFMNLMLVSTDREAWRDLSVGGKVQHRFPSGRYEFIVGEEARIGRYQMCSLFSPMFEFEDQAAAATADAAMSALLDEGNADDADRVAPTVEHAGPDQATREDPAGGFDGQRLRLKARTRHPMDRRDFLRGLFRRDGPLGKG
jgi:[NiFe] hydrogenase assembly HybE family chaperone